MRLYSSTDELLLEIDKNEWVSGDPLAWDIEADWQKLTVRERQGVISLRLSGLSVPARIEGKFFKGGKIFEATPTQLRHTGGGGFANLTMAGIHLNIATAKNCVEVTPNGVGFLSGGNDRDCLYRARNWWLQRTE